MEIGKRKMMLDAALIKTQEIAEKDPGILRRILKLGTEPLFQNVSLAPNDINEILKNQEAIERQD